jgi:hypothetical protein
MIAEASQQHREGLGLHGRQHRHTVCPAAPSPANGNRHDTGCVYRAFLVPKFVTDSSPKLGDLGPFLSWSEPEKQSRQRDLAFLTTQLTRWRSAVRARTGLPFFPYLREGLQTLQARVILLSSHDNRCLRLPNPRLGRDRFPRARVSQ